MLGHGHLVINHTVKMHYFLKNRLLNSQASIRQIKYLPVVVNDQRRVHSGHIVKIQYFFTSFVDCGMDQTNKVYMYIVMMAKNSKFYDPHDWGSYAKVWPYKSL